MRTFVDTFALVNREKSDMVAAPIMHISVDERGVAYIVGTRIKVQLIVREKLAQGRTPEAIQAAYPHLTLSQIYAALAYYCDHQEEIDAQIADSDAYAEQMRNQAGESDFVQRMKAEGRLPQ